MSAATRPSSGLGGRTLHGLIWSFAGTGTQAVLQLVTVGVLARVLSLEAFGVVAAAMVIIGVSMIVSQLGLTAALVHARRLHDRHVGAALALSLSLGLGLGACCFLGAAPLAAALRMDALAPVLRALALMFPLRACGLVAEALLQRQLRFRALSVIDVVSYAAGYGAVGVGLAIAGYGVWALVAAQLGQTAIRTVLLLTSARHSWRLSMHRGAMNRLLHYGGGLTFAQLANALATNVDNFVVGRWLGAGPLALYSRAYQLLVMPASLFSSVLDRVLFPVMSRVRGDRARLGRAYLQAVGIACIATLPAGAALVVLAPEVTRVLLGPNWDGAIRPLQILACGMMFRASFQLGDSLARAMGAVYASGSRQSAYAASVLLGAWVGHFWGIVGVAAGVLAALAVKYGMMAQLSLRLTGGSWVSFARAHGAGALLTATTSAFALVVAHACRIAGLPAIVTLVACGLAIVISGSAAIILAPVAYLGPVGSWIVTRLGSRSSRLIRLLARTSTPWRNLADGASAATP